MGNNNLELQNYISIDKLQEIQDNFTAVLGMGTNISDINGSLLSQSASMCDFCKFTRVSRIGSERCRKCDAEGSERAFNEGKVVHYECHAGLIDFVAPIIVAGQRVGLVSAGQVRLGDLDETKIIQTAKDINVNPTLYLAMAKNVPVISEEKLDAAMKFVSSVTNIISEMANKQYELEKAKQEVEYAAQLKQDFLANMSHEIRTPMNGVIGMAELALRENLSDSARDYVTQIKNSGKTLLTIINDILDYSKIESGKMDIIIDSYDPRIIVKDIAGILEANLHGKKIELEFEIDDNLPSRLYGDSIRIKQVILNLANNAVKFTPEGKVVVALKTNEISEDKINLVCIVKDTGIGISNENLKKLFVSFQQVDSKRNRQVEGTGLGLAISKRLVNLMGGEINVMSEYGKGSTFWFNVPQDICYDQAEDDSEVSSDSFIAPDAQILIVDDNEVNLTVAKGLLQPLEMQIDTALSGKEALEKIVIKKYDLIFMDHMMPELDGVETTRLIRRFHLEYEKTPIIALTANIVEGTKDLFLQEGMNDYVPKPIEMRTIVSKLRKWLPNEKLLNSDNDLLKTESKVNIKIQGLDTEYALGLLKTEALYMSVLKDYYHAIKKKSKLINECFESSDWKKYTIEVHALKSASRQIGAIQLADLAAKLEEAGNQNNVELIKEKTAKMLEMYLEYEPILQAIFVDNVQDKQKEKADLSLVSSLIDEFKQAFEDLDLSEMENISNKLSSYKYEADLGQLVEELSNAIEEIDMDKITSLVEDIADKIK